MEHLFVPYDIAKLAQENNFDEDCLAHYTLFGRQLNVRQTGSTYQGVILAPLYQQIVDWFRKEYDIFIGQDINYLDEDRNEICFMYDNKIGQGYIYNKDYYKAFNEIIEEAFKLIKKQ